MKDSVKRLVSSEQMLPQCMREMEQMLQEHGYFNFEIKRGNRSLSQNALYHVWIRAIQNYINEKNGTDYTEDEIHFRMKHDFLGYVNLRNIGSADIPVQLKSTKKLTKGEMHHYMAQIDQWSASIGLLLERPEDCQYQQLKEAQNR